MRNYKPFLCYLSSLQAVTVRSSAFHRQFTDKYMANQKANISPI